jgi:hypothetical protein
MNRRQFSLQMTSAALTSAVVTQAFAQTATFVIRIVRTLGWDRLMQREACIPGTVYSVLPDSIVSDVPGTKVCYSMELPSRGNNDKISAIPPGMYSAFARLSEKTGPVLELAGVNGRTAVQIHTGNIVDHSEGCILLGSTPVSAGPPQGADILTAGKCWIAGSKDARTKLLGLYGWTELDKTPVPPPPKRPAMVIIEG